VYRCRTRKHVARHVHPVDALVAEHVITRLSMPNAAELLVDDSRPDAADLRDQAQTIRGRLESLALDFADGAPTADQTALALHQAVRRKANQAWPAPLTLLHP